MNLLEESVVYQGIFQKQHSEKCDWLEESKQDDQYSEIKLVLPGEPIPPLKKPKPPDFPVPQRVSRCQNPF